MTPKNIKILYIRDFLVSLQFFAPLQIIYFTQATGSFTLSMSLLSIATISQALFELPTGVYSDKIGRRLTSISSTFSSIFSVLFYALGFGYWWLFVGAILEGLARALASGNDDALVYDTLRQLGREQEYHTFIGRGGAYQGIAFGIAAFVGGLVATKSFSLALWLSVLTQILAAIASLGLKEPTITTASDLNPYRHFLESVQSFKRNPKLRLLTLAKAWKEALGESSYQFSPAFISTLVPVWAVGLMRTASNLGSAIGFYLSGPIINRFKALPALTTQFVSDRVLMTIAYAFPSVASPILLATTSLTYGAGQVAQNTLSQQEFTDHQRATMGSIDSILLSIALASVTLLFGVFADKLGGRNMLLLAQILLMPVLLVYWRIFHHDHRANPQ